MLYDGNRVEQNKKEAAFYYEKAADDGNIEAMKCYIKMLRTGDGIEINLKEADEYQALLEDALVLKEQIERGKRDVSGYLKDLADSGNVMAMNYYAEMMYEGDGEYSSKEEASRYFKRAADSFKGQTNSTNDNNHTNNTSTTNDNDGLVSSNTNDGDAGDLVDENTKQKDELELELSTSDQLSINSMLSYADMLIHGEGVNVDKREAARYLKVAADNGDVDACCKLGKMLFKGDGIRSDLRGAVHYFNAAFDDDGDFVGNSDSMNFYGYMASNGLGMPADKKKAARMYKMASDQGNAYAMNNYGYMLSNGVELQVDKASAAKYYKLAADQGNKDAMINYGNMLYKGDGIEKDLEQSAYYYHMALNH